MNLKISFELDVHDLPTYSVPYREAIPSTLQNLGTWLGGLQGLSLQRILRVTADSQLDKLTRQLLIDAHEQDVTLAKRIFDNYSVEGTTQDGHHFCFNHREPGYEEYLLIEPVTTDNQEEVTIKKDVLDT